MRDDKEYKSYQVSHTTDQVRNLVSSNLNTEVTSIQRLDAGEINAVYFVSLVHGEDVVVRVPPTEKKANHFDREAWVFDQCRRIGVPTPEVIKVNMESMDFPESYMITKRLPGENGMDAKLTHNQRKDMCGQLGHYLSLVHSIKIPGFGPLVFEDHKWQGKHKTMLDYIKSDSSEGWWIDYVLENSLMIKEKLDKARDIFRINLPLLERDQGVLVHHDISPYAKNAIIQNARVTGIVDMEDSKSSDPVEDFAWFHFWGGSHADEFLEDLKSGYDDSSIFDDKFKQRLNLYKLMIGGQLLAYFHKRGNDSAVIDTKEKINAIIEMLN